MSKKIIIKTPEQIAKIQEAWKYLTELLQLTRSFCKPGLTLLEVEQYASDYLKKHQLKGAFKNYQGFPANCCLSLNDCIVHGIPDKTILKNGDLLKIDIGVEYKWCIADAAVSTIIGGEFTNSLGQKLIDTTKTWLDSGLQFFQPGKKTIERAEHISSHMKENGCSIIKPLTGHGVGQYVHEGPYIYNYPHSESYYITLQPWMVLAIEPITAITSEDYKEKPWNHRNLYTKKGDLWAQREYTIVITENGYEILAGVQ